MFTRARHSPTGCGVAICLSDRLGQRAQAIVLADRRDILPLSLRGRTTITGEHVRFGYMSLQYEWRPLRHEAGVSLLQFLQARPELKSFSMRKIKGWIDAGFVRVKGVPERFSRTKIPLHCSIELNVPEATERTIKFLFEDEAILLVDKPAGVSCDVRLEEMLKKMGKVAVLVHRLDKETTGVLLLAKSKKIKDYFVEEFRKGHVHKRYVAIVDGDMKEDSGTCQNYLGPIQRYQGHVKWGPVPQGGHFAHTDWQVMRHGKRACQVLLIPHTGRTHQLRVHMSGLHHPILGDYTYASSFRCPYPAKRVLLHAESLVFTHPVTSQPMKFVAELPLDMQKCLEELF